MLKMYYVPVKLYVQSITTTIVIHFKIMFKVQAILLEHSGRCLNYRNKRPYYEQINLI